MAGFCVRTGLLQDYLYRALRELSKGNLQDDPDRGGAQETDKRAQAYGFLVKLREEAEPQPTNGLVARVVYQLDEMGFDELYAEFAELTAEATGDPGGVASETIFRGVLHSEEFSNLQFRVYKNVDSKNTVSAKLRDLLKKCATKSEKDQLRVLRKIWRDWIRSERQIYWRERLRPCEEPLRYMTVIVDGATQSYCKIPSFQGTSVTRAAGVRRGARAKSHFVVGASAAGSSLSGRSSTGTPSSSFS